MSKNVLIADDNYICVEGILHSVNWNALGISSVQAVYDGISALDHIRSHPTDILVSDISMPGMSGLELFEQAIQENPSLKVILISAYDEFEYAKQAVRLGAFDYIEKPINYDYLASILQKVLDEIESETRNLEILKKSRPAMEEQFFRSLIQANGRETMQTLELYARYLGLNLDCSYCTILHISMEDSVELKQKLGIEEYCVRSMSLENSIRVLCTSFKINYILKDLTGYICVLGDDASSRSEFKRRVTDTFQKIADQYASRCDLAIGLGTIVNSIWKLPSSYANSLKALEYRFFFPEQVFLEAGSIARYGSEIILGQNIPEDDLIQCLCQNDQTGIKEWISSFLHSFPGNCDSRIIVYSRLYSVAARLLKFSYELNIINDAFEKKITGIFADPNQFKTIDQIDAWLMNICRDICERLQKSVTKYHESLCEAAVSYIQKNYKNSELNLNEIAQNLQISPAYLSTLFKQFRNQNISTFITDTRIDAACQLLRSTAQPLKVISSQVGYSNQYYFSSCFKKKMGVTPSAYREAQGGL